jgi:medium-chain acyl-[acyl-carrier-protein] hydrolase
MDSSNYFESEFTLNFYDLSQYSEAAPMTMLRLLQETAGDHHFPLGENVIDLYQKNLGWVLLSGVMEFDRYPKYKEKITIRTWLSQYKSIRGIRENLIFDEEQNIIGRAKGLWLFFDVAKRRPVPIPQTYKDGWGLNREVSIDYNVANKIPPLTDGEIMDVIKVKKFDIDANKHVNNLRYFQWLIEVVPDKVMKENFLHRIEGNFLNEANYGDQLLIYTKIIEMNREYLHTVFDLTTNKLCVTARTVWKKR